MKASGGGGGLADWDRCDETGPRREAFLTTKPNTGARAHCLNKRTSAFVLASANLKCLHINNFGGWQRTSEVLHSKPWKNRATIVVYWLVRGTSIHHTQQVSSLSGNSGFPLSVKKRQFHFYTSVCVVWNCSLKKENCFIPAKPCRASNLVWMPWWVATAKDVSHVYYNCCHGCDVVAMLCVIFSLR